MPEVLLVTDGACSGNPGPGGWAAVLVIDGEQRVLSGGEPRTTNNRMELRAVLEGLRALSGASEVLVQTDSRNVIGWLSEGWKRKNPDVRELAEAIDQVVAAVGHRVRYEWVEGHAGHRLNTLADSAAKQAGALFQPSR